jgi:hydroxyacylglutathione hydrolase
VGTADLGPKDAAVVVYCHSGRRSARAAEELTKRGYTNVKDLGGMDQWDK